MLRRKRKNKEQFFGKDLENLGREILKILRKDRIFPEEILSKAVIADKAAGNLAEELLAGKRSWKSLSQEDKAYLTAVLIYGLLDAAAKTIKESEAGNSGDDSPPAYIG